jgi:hypothetical protein
VKRTKEAWRRGREHSLQDHSDEVEAARDIAKSASGSTRRCHRRRVGRCDVRCTDRDRARVAGVPLVLPRNLPFHPPTPTALAKAKRNHPQNKQHRRYLLERSDCCYIDRC